MSTIATNSTVYSSENLSGKFFSGFFGLFFIILSTIRGVKVVELLITQKHDIRLYETSEIYVDFGNMGYCMFYGSVALFFLSVGLAFLYLGLFKKNKYAQFGKDFSVNMSRVMN